MTHRIFWFINFVSFFHLHTIVLAENIEANQLNDKDWWQTASFYQIYPRSFKDSDGDGIGDLNGITEQLPYLKSLGITATWLSPIFKSPMADFGYDISDYFSIQPEYGTMADFRRMIDTAQKLQIKIILDFVPNHTSDENKWFQRSVNRESGYEDFYVWHPGFPDPTNQTQRLPPTNWISLFRKSAWHFNEQRKEFYLHQFAIKQPDLNYRNPIVVDTMKTVLRYWLDMGVAGFRIDAVPHLFEIDRDENGNFKDEPQSGNTGDPDDWNYLIHIYTKDQNETIDMIYQWRDVLNDYQDINGGETRIMMTESYSPIDIVMRYYGNETHEGAHLPFNFQLLEQLRNGSTAFDYKNAIDSWMNNMPSERTPNWVMGNHDQNRVATRLGTDFIDIINMLLLTLPGASVTYNGEEIGMTDVWISWNDTVDPAACNTNPTIYEQFSRDPERTPFQWNNSTNAGFSNASKTWLPIASNYPYVNVAVEQNSNRSHLIIYKDLIQLRSERTMQLGEILYKPLNDDILLILRMYEMESTYATIINVGKMGQTIDLSNFDQLPGKLQYFIVSLNSNKIKGDFVHDKQSIRLEPTEGIVLKSEPVKWQRSTLKNYYVYLITNT